MILEIKSKKKKREMARISDKKKKKKEPWPKLYHFVGKLSPLHTLAHGLYICTGFWFFANYTKCHSSVGQFTNL